MKPGKIEWLRGPMHVDFTPIISARYGTKYLGNTHCEQTRLLITTLNRKQTIVVCCPHEPPKFIQDGEFVDIWK